jgi:hypothetical protein
LDPHAAVRLQRAAGNTALAGTLQRDKTRRPGAPQVGAVEEGLAVDGVAPGRAGFARRMMAETGEMAERLRRGGELDKLLLKQVAPDLSGVADQERVVGRAKPLWEEKKSGFATASTNKHYQERADACQEWLNGVRSDRERLNGYAENYNAFVPRANSFFISSARLDSMQTLLGATDNAAMVAAVQAGLADALKVAGKYRDAVEGSTARSGPETLDVPAQDDTVESQAREVTLAVQHLNNAYRGFRIAMSGAEIAEIEKEGEKDRARLAKIEQAKQAVKSFGKLIDTSMAVVSGAPAAIANVSNTLAKSEAQFNAFRNKRAIMRGKEGVHNPTYLTTDKDGNMVVANAQTRMQQGASGEETPMPEGGFTLPTSVENILGTVTDFIYAGEVREINIRLQGIAARVSAVTNWKQGEELTKATEAFRISLKEFAKRCNDLQQRIAARRNAYLNFGVQLDRFARSNRELSKEGLGTGAGRERYATIMVAASQIREVLALGRNATAGFGSARDFAVWVYEAQSRRQMSSVFSYERARWPARRSGRSPATR